MSGYYQFLLLSVGLWAFAGAAFAVESTKPVPAVVPSCVDRLGR